MKCKGETKGWYGRKKTNEVKKAGGGGGDGHESLKWDKRIGKVKSRK